ncbi:hypothetical protein IT418_02370 [bacterium]|nr:hypothetical protein [bacterium]
MRENFQLQKISENAVRFRLLELGHTNVFMNIRMPPYEFDLVSTRKTKQFVHEVRSTRNARICVLDLFPRKKLLHIIKGVALFYPQAEIFCHFVLVYYDSTTKSEIYPIGDLL